MEKNQRTISKPVVFIGKGLHTGRMIRLEVQPAPANSGIVFKRTDAARAYPVVAHAMNVSSTDLCTTIGKGASSVATVEHILSAMHGLAIDNARIELNGPEVPILDGSAVLFVREFLRVGIRNLGTPKNVIRVRKPFELRHGDQFIAIEPADELSITCSIDYPKKTIGKQSIDYLASVSNYLNISDARTFCHISDVNQMRKLGLARGGSLENAVVVTDVGIMNEDGLRSPDEFVRHKLLDLIGDIYLLGGPAVGRITAHKPGHTLHAEFMKELIKRDLLVIGGSSFFPQVMPTPLVAHFG